MGQFGAKWQKRGSIWCYLGLFEKITPTMTHQPVKPPSYHLKYFFDGLLLAY
jgi:hypothetical protein